jgi:hypothetical protein
VNELHYDFRFTRAYLIAGLGFGVRPATCHVRVSTERLAIKFGLWHATVALDNVADAAITGPYQFLKTAGPPHLSLADRGITFATNGDRGLCIKLHNPIRGIEPTGLIRHPGITVTVADCDALAKALRP